MKPPEGRRHWTLKLLAGRLVALELVDSVSPENGPQDVKKNELKPWRREMWCLPGKPSAEFVCAMEDVLDVYQRPYDSKHPLVCLDETCKQLIGRNAAAPAGGAWVSGTVSP